jgi:CxxC-x17-CxxC domain-containing protein
MESKTLTCQDCGKQFEFSAEEQQFFADKGFAEPKRCSACRSAKKQDRNTTFTKVNCAECGVETEVPFVPKSDRPVYCRACFEAKGGRK